MELHDTQGKFIGVDPVQFLTIAAVAFEGIYRKHYLSEEKVIVVNRPGKDNFSTQQIARMEHLMSENSIIQHAFNNHIAGRKVQLTVLGRNRKVDGLLF